MPTLALFRLISILATIPVFHFFKGRVTDTLFYSIVFGHYTLALTYSRPQIENLTRNIFEKIFIVFVMLFAAVLFYLNYRLFPVFVIFGIHSMLTDLYVESPYGDNGRVSKLLLPSRLFVNIFSYCVILHKDPHLKVFSSSFLKYGFIVSVIIFVYVLWQNRKYLTGQTLSKIAAFEGVGILVTIIFAKCSIPLGQFILYHGVFSLFVFSYRNKGRWLTLVNQHLGVSLGFGILFLWIDDFDLALKLNLLAGYIHLISSFFVSSLNPRFIRQTLQARLSH